MKHFRNELMGFLLTSLAAGCSGGTDVVAQGERTISDEGAEGPSAEWELAHAMSQGALGGRLMLVAEDLSGQPASGVGMCVLPGADCATSDADGFVELRMGEGRRIVTGKAGEYCPSTITLYGDGSDLDLRGISFQLHTAADLERVYADAGELWTPNAATIRFEVTGALPAGVRAEVAGPAAETASLAYVGSDGRVSTELDATSDVGVIYVLGAPSGDITLELSRDGLPCDELATAGWVSTTPSAIDTFAVVGGLTFGGLFDCG